jgi:hypothetical protein
MKFIKAIFCLLFFFNINFSFTQDVSGLASQILTLEQNINHKDFVKSWKKKKNNFEKECKSAISEKDLVTLLNHLISTYNSSTKSSIFIIPDLRYDAFCNALLSLIKQFPEESLSFSEKALDKWRSEVSELMRIEKSRFEKESKLNEAIKDKERLKIKDSVVLLFEKNYNLILEGANKGSFEGVIEKSIANNKYPVKLSFGTLARCHVLVDEDDVYQFKLYYNTSKDEKLANQIQEGIYNVINKNLSIGFKESKMFEGNFVTSFMKIFDFQAEKFADTAKHPSIELGIKKDSFEVYFSIIEPLFKR